MKNKNLPITEVAQLKRTIKSLKQKVDQKDRKIQRLLSDVKTLEAALDKSVIYINKELEDIPVEDVIAYFNSKKSKNKNIDNLKDKRLQDIDSLKEKWKCHKCGKGYLRLIIINRQDGRYYFRACVNCEHRTDLKAYEDSVSGVL